MPPTGRGHSWCVGPHLFRLDPSWCRGYPSSSLQHCGAHALRCGFFMFQGVQGLKCKGSEPGVVRKEGMGKRESPCNALEGSGNQREKSKILQVQKGNNKKFDCPLTPRDRFEPSTLRVRASRSGKLSYRGAISWLTKGYIHPEQVSSNRKLLMVSVGSIEFECSEFPTWTWPQRCCNLGHLRCFAGHAERMHAVAKLYDDHVLQWGKTPDCACHCKAGWGTRQCHCV